MSIYEKITNEIISMIESENILPWQKPWNVIPARNLLSGKAYRGFNSLYLNSQPFKSPFWMTFLQCKNFGGRVKAGEKSRMVIYWEKSTYEDQDSGKLESAILSKVYFVFNLEQTEGIPENKIPQILNTHENPIQAAEAIIHNFPNRPQIQFHNEDSAYYSPSRDLISLPSKESFKNQEDYYSTLFHESVHYAESRIMPHISQLSISCN